VSDERYAIGDLATLGGVSRRTVRYYVQEGLIGAPLGVGRGNHYDATHLEQLRRVKAMQEAGLTLETIRHSVAAPPTAAGTRAAAGTTPRTRTAPAAPNSLWRRLTIAPGLELHVNSTARVPSPGALRELADWCQRHLGATLARPDDNDKD
jgi:DNA-binding transcriptional MerR regulator